ncbi:MAG: DUF4294 domain-containing protein [Wenyingzhuangia sp.]|uniref:DUF4294 domain-containing protein n=1 Tax=Wenyingzhuangia sp. TaxID=1964193 RepID=UPI00321AC69C
MKLTQKILFFILISITSNAQISDLDVFDEKYKSGIYITDADQEVLLDTVVVFSAPKFTNNYDKRYYSWFTKKTYKAYPYALLAKEKVDSLNLVTYGMTSSRKKKKYIKKKQRVLEEQFSDNIKKLTKTEGRILIKLIHRLTGETVNEHIKDKRGKYKAFWYRLSARFFKIDLDLKYNPENIMEDYMIENILQQGFVNGDLERCSSVLPGSNLPLSVREIHIEKKK